MIKTIHPGSRNPWEHWECRHLKLTFDVHVNSTIREQLSFKKITYLDLHVVIEEDVAQLQVSVDDSVVVQVVDTLEQLSHVVAGLRLSDSLTPLVQLQQGLKQKRKDKG